MYKRSHFNILSLPCKCVFLITSSPSQILFPPLHHDRDADAYHGLADQLTSSDWVDKTRAWTVFWPVLYWPMDTELFVTKLFTNHNLCLDDHFTQYKSSQKYILSRLHILLIGFSPGTYLILNWCVCTVYSVHYTLQYTLQLCISSLHNMFGYQPCNSYLVYMYLYTSHYLLSALWLVSRLCVCISTLHTIYLKLYLFQPWWLVSR